MAVFGGLAQYVSVKAGHRDEAHSRRMTYYINRRTDWPLAREIVGILYRRGILRKPELMAAAVSAMASSVVLFPAMAQAQVAPVTPAQQQLAPTREEVDRLTSKEAPKAGKLMVDGGIERAPCALDDPAYADIKVTITAAEFNNLQGATADDLRPAYADLIGKPRPISTICTIRDAAATILRNKGYLAAVQVPTQRIENGVVKFEVLFARVVAVRVRGDAGKDEKLLAGYLSKLTQDKIFNRFTAERYLLLARDIPGVDVRLSLKPAGTSPGELVGEVSVIRTPLDVDLNIQNYASHSTGRWSGLLRGQAYGVLGQGDRLSASVSSTADFKEQQIAQLGYDMKLGTEGLTVGGNLTYAYTRPDIGTPGVSLKAQTVFGTADASYPIKRSQAFSAVATVGMDFLNQNVNFNGTPISRDHLRVAFARLDVDVADVSETQTPNWHVAGTFEFRQGLDILGASGHGLTGAVNTSRVLGDPTSSLFRFSGQAELNLGRGASLAVLPRAQYSFTPLLSFEQYSAGNYSIGRGYDPGYIIGDNGIGSAVEVRWDRFAPFPRRNFAVQPFVFVDAAWTWLKQDTNFPGAQKVVSVGGGVHTALNNRFRIDATVAVPLRADGVAALTRGRPDPRFLISLTTKLWPWGKM
jgi:hemolysin activation/secretion protein